jgi:hypothetical protein
MNYTNKSLKIKRGNRVPWYETAHGARSTRLIIKKEGEKGKVGSIEVTIFGVGSVICFFLGVITWEISRIRRLIENRDKD